MSAARTVPIDRRTDTLAARVHDPEIVLGDGVALVGYWLVGGNAFLTPPVLFFGWRTGWGLIQAFRHAAIAEQLRLDPIVRGPVARGALPAIAELRQTFDRRLVALEIKPPHQDFDGIAAWRS